MKIDGACHCGRVTYEAEIDPVTVAICHCTDCQTMSGSAFRTVVRSRENGFKLLSGDVKTYVKTAESGNKRMQAFCPECGTPIYAAILGDGPKVYSIRVGTARQRNELVPQTQYWTRSALKWVGELGSVHKLEKQPVFNARGGVR